MDKLKQLVGMLRVDKTLIKELQRLVGARANPSLIFETEAKLRYVEAEKLLTELKVSDSLHQFADKILKAQKDIERLRTLDYQVCLYLNSLGSYTRLPVINNLRVVQDKIEQKVILDFSGMGYFNHIASERIPIVLSEDRVIDLAKMPHLLVAGMTGSGKSVFLNAAILSILYKMSPEQCKLAIIDPKRVEFTLYRGVEHLYAPVATRLEQIEQLLNNLVLEMESRYGKLESVGAKNLESYNAQVEHKLPYIVVIIDEMADLMLVDAHNVTNQIERLAQLARAAGIHLIMATQRPVVKIMTGLMKANMPARIAFRVASKQDSRVILDEPGAEALKGAGELLFKFGNVVERCQGIYVSEEQIKQICRRL